MPKPNTRALTRSDLLDFAFQQRPRFIACAWSSLADILESESIYQELLHAILRPGHRFESPAQLKSWSWKVLQRRCARRVHHHDPRQTRFDAPLKQILDEDLRTRPTTEITDQSDALRICIDRLPHRNRLLVRLCYLEGKKALAAARLMNRRPDKIYHDLQQTFERATTCLAKRIAIGRLPLGATASPRNRHLQRLAFRYLDDELTTPDTIALGQALAADPDSRRLFNDIRLYGALLHELGRTFDHLARTERPLPHLRHA
jgi:RNA polymerase sigma-70 factor (ECF subfamily)